MKRRLSGWVVGSVTLCLAASGYAQPLVEHVPADAAIYVGWRGTTEPETGYTGSRWEAIANESKLAQFVNETLPQIGQVIAQRNPQQSRLAKAGAALAREMIRHTTAMYASFPTNAWPRVALLCEAGTDAESLKQAFDDLAAEMPKELQAATASDGGIVSLMIDDASMKAGVLTLSSLPTFKTALAQVGGDGTMFAFINIDAARDAIEEKVTTTTPPSNDPNWAELTLKFLAASGLNDTHSIAISESFKGRNWQTEAFISAPSPRKGLLSLGDFQPIDQDLLKRIPAGAYMASQVPLDLKQVLAVTRQIASDTYPPARDMLDKGIGAATLAIGKNVESDLLQSLGGQWVTYSAPQVGGSSLWGTVLVNKLSNVLKAKQSIGALSIFLSNSGHTFTRRKFFSLGTLTTTIGGTTVTYAALPVLSPAWAIKDGYLYVGLYPQTVAAAANYTGESLADSASYKAIIDPLKQPVAAAGVSYLNLPAMLDASYGSLLVAERTVFGLSDVFAAPAPEPMAPSLATLSAQATPVGSILWLDDAGIHSRAIEPYPGAASILSLSMFDYSSVSAIAGLGGFMQESMMAPSFNRSPCTPRR